jgi:hypothetical protein
MVLCALGLGSCVRLAEPSALLTPGPVTPETLLRLCDGPLRLAEGALELVLSAGDAARIWGRDRASLARCAARHKALAAHIRRSGDAR